MMLVSQHGPSSTPPPPDQYHRPPMDPAAVATQQTQQHHRVRRKRKADSQDANNERLSKRLSLLNLEQNGSKLYVPVENPKATSRSPLSQPSQPQAPPAAPPVNQDDDSMMQLDDSKYKVYIYNIDDELSSESEAEDGRLVFLPDIEKHLRINRVPIPPPILPNSDGELAGMQMVLYNVPSSISVPQEQDSVRKAIIESRARIRARQKGEEPEKTAATSKAPSSPPLPTAQTPPLGGFKPLQLDTIPEVPNGVATTYPQASTPWGMSAGEQDADAMEID